MWVIDKPRVQSSASTSIFLAFIWLLRERKTCYYSFHHLVFHFAFSNINSCNTFSQFNQVRVLKVSINHTAEYLVTISAYKLNSQKTKNFLFFCPITMPLPQLLQWNFINDNNTFLSGCCVAYFSAVSVSVRVCVLASNSPPSRSALHQGWNKIEVLLSRKAAENKQNGLSGQAACVCVSVCVCVCVCVCVRARACVCMWGWGGGAYTSVYVNNIQRARVNIGWYLASAISGPRCTRLTESTYLPSRRRGKCRRGQPCALRAISRAKYQPIFTNARWILYLYLKSAKRKLLVDVRALRALETAVLEQWFVAAELTWSIFFQLHSSTRR